MKGGGRPWKKKSGALEENGTWIIESLLPGKKPISYKWVY